MPYKCTFYTPRGDVISINPTNCEVVSQQHISILTAEELAVVANISQCIARLQNGKLVEYNFQPNSFEDPSEIIRLEWLESGNLKNCGPVKKIYNLVDTVNDALISKRVFCCERKLVSSLPKRRDVSEGGDDETLSS